GRLDLVCSEHAQPRFLRVTGMGRCLVPAILTSLRAVDHSSHGAAAPLCGGRCSNPRSGAAVLGYAEALVLEARPREAYSPLYPSSTIGRCETMIFGAI